MRWIRSFSLLFPTFVRGDFLWKPFPPSHNWATKAELPLLEKCCLCNPPTWRLGSARKHGVCPREKLGQPEAFALGQATPLQAGPQFSCLRLRKHRLQKLSFSDTFGRPCNNFSEPLIIPP